MLPLTFKNFKLIISLFLYSTVITSATNSVSIDIDPHRFNVNTYTLINISPVSNQSNRVSEISPQVDGARLKSFDKLFIITVSTCFVTTAFLAIVTTGLPDNPYRSYELVAPIISGTVLMTYKILKSFYRTN